MFSRSVFPLMVILDGFVGVCAKFCCVNCRGRTIPVFTLSIASASCISRSCRYKCHASKPPSKPVLLFPPRVNCEKVSTFLCLYIARVNHRKVRRVRPTNEIVFYFDIFMLSKMMPNEMRRLPSCPPKENAVQSLCRG